MVATPCFQKVKKIKVTEFALKALSTLPVDTCYPLCSCVRTVHNKYCVHTRVSRALDCSGVAIDL